MSDIVESLRRPIPQYKGTNGFKDPLTLQLHGQRLDACDISAAGVVTDEGTLQREQRMRDAVESHRLAEDVLEEMGSYAPSLAAMKEELEKPETSATITARITELQEQHREGLNKLFDLQIQDYEAEVTERDLSSDTGIPLEELDRFNQTLRSNPPPHLPLASTISTYRYAYASALLPLQRQRAPLLAREEAARRQRDAQFPASIAEYRSIKSRHIQLRVAQFLAADTATQEHMMTRFGWAYRQVAPLLEDFKNNIIFHKEIEASMRDIEAKDPRRRPPD